MVREEQPQSAKGAWAPQEYFFTVFRAPAAENKGTARAAMFLQCEPSVRVFSAIG